MCVIHLLSVARLTLARRVFVLLCYRSQHQVVQRRFCDELDTFLLLIQIHCSHGNSLSSNKRKAMKPRRARDLGRVFRRRNTTNIAFSERKSTRCLWGADREATRHTPCEVQFASRRDLQGRLQKMAATMEFRPVRVLDAAPPLTRYLHQVSFESRLPTHVSGAVATDSHHANRDGFRTSQLPVIPPA